MPPRRGNTGPDLAATGIAGFSSACGTRAAPSTAGKQDPTWAGTERTADSAILSHPVALAQESSLDTITDYDDVRDWFYPACAAVNIPSAGKLQDAFARLMDTERRLVIEVVPEKWITFDAAEMMQASIPAGRKMGLLE